MIYQQTDMSNVDNVGLLDRINRVIVGTTLITVTVLFTAIPPAAIAGIVALGVYAGLTGFIGWDPLYALVKGMRREAAVQTPSPSPVHRHQGEQPSTGDYKKAA